MLWLLLLLLLGWRCSIQHAAGGQSSQVVAVEGNCLGSYGALAMGAVGPALQQAACNACSSTVAAVKGNCPCSYGALVMGAV